mmetsp:Transcript_15414/g.26478  ORF Transcript_15414/g.26478 Transcript_15414/m.26478 type:complete len:263 (-) Transcript_15414:428-1216(-)
MGGANGQGDGGRGTGGGQRLLGRARLLTLMVLLVLLPSGVLLLVLLGLPHRLASLRLFRRLLSSLRLSLGLLGCLCGRLVPAFLSLLRRRWLLWSLLPGLAGVLLRSGALLLRLCQRHGLVVLLLLRLARLLLPLGRSRGGRLGRRGGWGGPIDFRLFGLRTLRNFACGWLLWAFPLVPALDRHNGLVIFVLVLILVFFFVIFLIVVFVFLFVVLRHVFRVRGSDQFRFCLAIVFRIILNLPYFNAGLPSRTQLGHQHILIL